MESQRFSVGCLKCGHVQQVELKEKTVLVLEAVQGPQRERRHRRQKGTSLSACKRCGQERHRGRCRTKFKVQGKPGTLGSINGEPFGGAE
jgi:hypothetical protein